MACLKRRTILPGPANRTVSLVQTVRLRYGVEPTGRAFPKSSRSIRTIKLMKPFASPQSIAPFAAALASSGFIAIGRPFAVRRGREKPPRESAHQ